MIVGLDFDGTLVSHQYPDIGKDIGAFPWLKAAQDKGAKFVLFTMRSGKTLEEAVKHVEGWGIKLYGVNVNPTQHQWTSSPKAYCHVYVDDAALGAPLIVNTRRERLAGKRPYIDWSRAGLMLVEAVERWFSERQPD